MRLGLFGGTFDPVHVAHMAIADRVCDACSLDRILFIPASSPPHKDDRSVTPFEHRLRMVELAIGDDPRFAVSIIESERAGKSFTEDTLSAMNAMYPDSDLFWIIGSDSACELHMWRNAGHIVEMARFVVVARPGWPVDDAHPELREKLTLVDMPEMDVSATDIRARVRQGKSIRGMTSQSVADYIRSKRLYVIDDSSEKVQNDPEKPFAGLDLGSEAERYINCVLSRVEERRLRHCIETARLAARLARQNGGSYVRATIAGLVHDIARSMSDAELLAMADSFDDVTDYERAEPKLLHGAAASQIVRAETGCADDEILFAIRHHTCGHPDFGILGKCLMVADYAEPGRDFEKVYEIRRELDRDINSVLAKILDNKVRYLKSKGIMIDSRTIELKKTLDEPKPDTTSE